MRIILAVLVLSALPVSAQQRASDTPFADDALNDTLSGQTIEFFDASKATYAADGSYEYRYRPEDPAWTGTWQAEASQVCVTFDNGFSRCDTMVMAANRLVMIIEDGTRFPVREIAPIPE